MAGWLMSENGIFQDARRLSQIVYSEGLAGRGALSISAVLRRLHNRICPSRHGRHRHQSARTQLSQLLAGTNLPPAVLRDLGFDLMTEQSDCDNVGQSGTTRWRTTNNRVVLVRIKSRTTSGISSARLSGAVDVRRAQAGNVEKRDLCRV